MPYIPTDPVTKRPLQQQPVVQNQPQTQNQPVANQQPQFDAAAYAAQEAQRQMLYAMQHGERPTQETYEAARQKAYGDATEFQRQKAMENYRSQLELQRKQQEQFQFRPMNQDEIKDASGLMNAHANIMELYHQNQDIKDTDPYRTAYVGTALKGPEEDTNPTIRLYEATRGGSIISLGRGLLQDTGQVAGKEQAQDLIKKLMPGPGDDRTMAARKSIDMMHMEMAGLKAKIDALPSNVDSTPLRNAYTAAYADYAPLVNQFGSDAQKTYPMSNPKDLGYSTAAPAVAVTQPSNKPAVQVVSNPVNESLNAQAGGQTAAQAILAQSGMAQQAQKEGKYLPTDPTTKQPLEQQIPSWAAPPPPERGAAYQQAQQLAGGSRVGTVTGAQEPAPANVMATLQPQPNPQETIFQTWPKQAGETASGVINWLGSMLPENWQKGTFQQ